MKALVTTLAAAGLAALLTGPTANAQGPPLPEPVVHPLQVTGPPAERLNLIILGDGYQWDQQSLFFEDVDRNLAVMWATEPFKSYRNYINVYAVEIASIDYGVRRDPDGRVRHPDGTIRDTGEREGPIDAKNTALRLWYSDGLTNPLARGTTYGPAPLNCQDFADYYPPGVNPCETGNQAHNRILDTYVAPVLGIPRTSQNVQTLAIFNTFTYGGIGGTQATTSGGSPQGPLISLHELGHSLGTMADEYPYSSRDVVRPCYTGGEPGSFHHTIYTSAAQMIADQHKWWRWIGEESLSGGTIGLHEGGGTFPCGQRRPSEHSIMRWIGFDWDQVGREHMVARITGRVTPGRWRCATRRRARCRRTACSGSRPSTRSPTSSTSRGGSAARTARWSTPPTAAASTSGRSTSHPAPSSTSRCATRSAPTAGTGCATPRPATPRRTRATTGRGSSRPGSGPSARRRWRRHRRPRRSPCPR